jgi:stage V sporulation protein B
MILVPNGLGRAGFGVEAATTLFGYLTGMAQPLMMMATIPTMSLAASLVPAVSEACTLQRPDEILRKTTSAFKICMLVVVPASVGMWTLAGPISGTLYGTMKAAPVIAHLAPSIAFLGVFQVTTGALQGFGKTLIPMWNMLFGAVVKAIAVWQLTSLPAFHVLGAAWASNLNFALVAAINILFLYRSGIPFPLWDSLKILLASLCMGMAGRAVALFFMDKSGVLAALVSGMTVSGLVYVAAVILSGCLTREEAARLPVLGKYLRKFWH